MKCIILDRDGVINHDSPAYIKSPHEWQPIAGSLEAIARLHRHGWRVFVVTNQSALARGLLQPQGLRAIHDKMLQLVAQHGGRIDGVYFCPHHPDENCRCRKPRTGMLEDIEKDIGQALRGCPLVGDSLSDLEAGWSKGCRPMLVRTGKGERTLALLRERRGEAAATAPVFADLGAVVQALLGEDREAHDKKHTPRDTP